MVKSEQELQKVVRAMSFLFMNSTFLAYSMGETPKEFMKGVSATVALKPGQSTEGESLITCSVKSSEETTSFIPTSGYVTNYLTEFVLATRKVFTSIHEFKKVLSVTIDKMPDEQDIEWAFAVMKSYGVERTKEYIIGIALPEDHGEALIEIGFGQKAVDNGQLIVASGYFIEKMEGLESLASNEEDRAKLKTGLKFREL